MATQNEQPDPVKNRWTRWYMWAAYATAVLVVVIVIIVVVDSGDSATATPAEPVASAAANQTAEQTKEAAERHEEQTKTAEQQAEEMPEVSQAEYCEQLSTNMAMIVLPSVDLQIRYSLILGGDLSLMEGGGGYENNIIVSTLDVMDSVDRGAQGIKSMHAPESAKKTHRKAEDLADDVLKKTDDVRDKQADYVKWLQSESDADEAVKRFRELGIEVQELNKDSLNQGIEINGHWLLRA